MKLKKAGALGLSCVIALGSMAGCESYVGTEFMG